jgi:hypothetical protein
MNFYKEVLVNLFIISAFVLTIWNCSDLSNPINSYDRVLDGIWEEEFVWNSDNIILFGGGRFENNFMAKKTTINFSGNHFEVKILPPNRILTSIGDSIIVTVSSDTIYTGLKHAEVFVRNK